MKLSELKTLTTSQAEILEANGWTVKSLAIAEAKILTSYKGIGKVTAQKVISEAANMVNKSGLNEAEALELERYYQKTPSWKVLEDWEMDGLSIQNVALATAGGLAALKGINESQALILISHAQTIVNKQKLYESRQSAPGAVPKTTSAAFPVEWLSGQVEPPAMSVRVKANFDKAKAEYEAVDG
jgi:hypothetical protein